MLTPLANQDSASLTMLPNTTYVNAPKNQKILIVVDHRFNIRCELCFDALVIFINSKFNDLHTKLHHSFFMISSMILSNF